jgi:hypothetical protein
MSPSLKNITKRTADKAHAAAAGSPVPAGQDPPAPEALATPAAAERGSMRKRVRKLSRTRDVLLRELGALVVEMRRLGRDNPELVERKAAEVLAVDEELRGLRTGLESRQTVEQIVTAGIAGSCSRCGNLVGTDDRFCSRCGLGVVEPAAAEPAVAEPTVAEPAVTEPAVAEPAVAEPASAAADPVGVAAAPPPPPPPPPAPSPIASEPVVSEAPAPHRAQDELTAAAPPKP